MKPIRDKLTVIARGTEAALVLTPLLALALFSATSCGGTAATLATEDKDLVVIRRDDTGDPKSIDPHIAGDVVSSKHCGMAYECLLQYDYLKRPPTLIPSLAAEMPVYDAATTSYTFKLRDDVYFSDDRCWHPDASGKKYRDEGESLQETRGKGRKLNAHDIVYSFKRLAALPDSGGFWVIEGQIKGLDEFRNKALDLAGEGPSEDPEQKWREHLNDAPVEGLKVIDDRTVRVTLNKPYPQFLYAITLSYGAAVAREAAEYYDKDFFRKPVGTGPFILKRWKQNWEVVWVRNPNFRPEFFPTSDAPEDAPYKPLMGKKLPIADVIHFRIIAESQASFLSFLAGNLDVSGLDKDQFDKAISPQQEVTSDLAEKNIKLQRYAEATIHYISFNMNDTTVGTPAGEKGRAIRRAMALAFPREDYIARYLNNRGSPAPQLVPPGMKGHQPSNNMPSQRHDPEAARKVLQDAGFDVKPKGTAFEAVDPATGKPVTITVSFRSTAETTKQYATFLASAAAQAGIVVQPELLTFSEFLKRQDDGKGQAYDAGWVMDYPDAQNMLQLLYGPNKPPGINSAAYASAEYDRLYEEMAVLDDNVPEQLARKLELIEQMHKVLEQDVPWVLIEYRVIYALYHDWHLISKPNEFAYTYYKFWYSDSARRSEMAAQWSSAPVWPGLVIGLILLVPVGLVGMKIVRQN